ncbi:MAG: hypothetical protein GXO76_07665, partial [Calditrichaeota bacterium]|nr:hypothetical protein [Calditrichota bacterium]
MMIKMQRYVLRGVFFAGIALLFLTETFGLGTASQFSGTGTRHNISLAGKWLVREKESDRWQTIRIPGTVPKATTYFFKRDFQLPDSYRNY